MDISKVKLFLDGSRTAEKNLIIQIKKLENEMNNMKALVQRKIGLRNIIFNVYESIFSTLLEGTTNIKIKMNLVNTMNNSNIDALHMELWEILNGLSLKNLRVDNIDYARCVVNIDYTDQQLYDTFIFFDV